MSPVLEPGEQVLDRMTLSTECRVVWMGMLAVPSRGNAGRDAEAFEGSAEAIAVAAAVGDQFGGRRQRVDQEPGALVVAHLPRRQQQDHGPGTPIADNVQLGVQPALGAPDLPRTPFCNRPAAVRCDLRCVLSMMMRSGGPAASANAARMRANTPLRVQRTWRLQGVLCGPWIAGASHQRRPLRWT